MGSVPIDSTSECVSASYQLLLDNTKHRLNDLRQRFSNLQAARREGQANDILVLEEQVFEILRDWNSELSSFSPASSLLGISIGSLDLLLQVCDKDDATSALAEQPPLKPQPDFQGLHLGTRATSQEDNLPRNDEHVEHSFRGLEEFKGSDTGLHNAEISIPDSTTLLDYQQMDMYQESENGHLMGAHFTEECQKDAEPNVLPYICPPPSAFMGPKCALWDCLRPALGSEWYRDYCSSFHATLSSSEEFPGLTPVVRPGGIHLKDSLLLVAANAKAQGKNVGIPKCEGAATAKTPWNSTELFDVTLLEGETVREWLFFDKHKRAFESGRRKQRSLPDHSGRGWHESRKLVMMEFGGQKKSYFMDPQPSGCFQWHLYEYEISNNSNAYALYKLELKLVNEKKGPKGKVTKDSPVDPNSKKKMVHH
ncbi:hypothetical protein Dsin_031335 [Dipteronia sinensis]|uniref:Transcription factor VOZ1 n=1 Tax=Dipteronia sinensis TaxID=43782 RepID=A0AAD9ZMP6_9ROSI|nr:hypothetical protein Dsin_031335 [Dipteronia sinensis]